jgi:hypothetical protein
MISNKNDIDEVSTVDDSGDGQPAEVQDNGADETGCISVEGHVKIFDPNNGEVIIDKRNQIHYENISESLAQSLANKNLGYIYQMSFGNGGTSVDPTGIITYLPPNSTGQNADLYNETYSKVVDDNSSTNTDTTRNNLTVLHTSGKVYTDILVSTVLDYGEPLGQQAFDNSTNLDGEYVFDELGIKTWNGSASDLKLVTHLVMHPVQKALNRQLQIDYTIRIQALTNLSA